MFALYNLGYDEHHLMKNLVLHLSYYILHLFQNENGNRYKFRANGLFSSIIGKKSYLRP